MGRLDSLLNFEAKWDDAIFWQDAGKTYTYSEVKMEALAFAPVFQGLPKGGICSLEGFAPLDVWIFMLSAWEAGASILPFSERAPEASIERALEQLPWAVRFQKNGAAVSVIRNPLGASPTTSDLVIMTSGSTGAPKGIAHTRESLAASARATLAFYRWQEGDSWLLSLDPSHIGGLQILLRVWLGRGLVYYGGEPKDALDALMRRSCDYLSLVPTQLLRLLESPEALVSLRKSRAILLGGAATQEGLIAKARDLRLPVSITYGSSETASQITAFPAGTWPDRRENVGRPMPLWSLGEEANGDLWIEGEGLMQGYWQGGRWHPVVNGRFRLSDRGRLAGDDLLIEGRRDQVFQVGGENLAPQEILGPIECLYPSSDLLLIAKEDEVFGHVPELMIRSRKRPDIGALLKCWEGLLHVKRPREIWWFATDEVTKLSKAHLEHLRNEGGPLLQRLWKYEKI